VPTVRFEEGPPGARHGYLRFAAAVVQSIQKTTGVCFFPNGK
jgi:hypothetical protein